MGGGQIESDIWQRGVCCGVIQFVVKHYWPDVTSWGRCEISDELVLCCHKFVKMMEL